MTTTTAAAARRVTRSTVVDATPQQVFDLLADPRNHPVIDGSGAVRDVLDAPVRLCLGAEFTMRMKAGASYTTRNTVIVFEPDREIAWKHRARHTWHWSLWPVLGGTEVTETFDWTAKRAPRLVTAIGIPRTAGASIDATLEKVRLHFSQ